MSAGHCIRCVVVLAAVWAGCGRGAADEGRVDPVPAPGAPPVTSGSGDQNDPSHASGDGVPSDALHLEPPRTLVFQPGFHQALRWSYYTPGQVTFRYRIPVSRTGARIRVALRAGNGALAIHRASVARAGTGGTLGSEPVALRFGGAESISLSSRERTVSDPVPFAVAAGSEIAVSFTAEGAAASSAIDAFPDSFIAPGDQSFAANLVGATARHRLTGVHTVDVEAGLDRAFVAIGDSITEGYVSGADDHRRAWPALAGVSTQLPVVNGAVSGQGLWAANEYLAEDVGVLQGVTDCVVLLGTNDLAADAPEEMIDRLTRLFRALSDGGCRVWAGTLLPKEKTSSGDLAEVNSRRAQINEWLRNRSAAHGVIDFERAVAAPGDTNRFAPGLGRDGIHPSYAGQQVMADYAAQILGAQPW